MCVVCAFRQVEPSRLRQPCREKMQARLHVRVAWFPVAGRSLRPHAARGEEGQGAQRPAVDGAACESLQSRGLARQAATMCAR